MYGGPSVPYASNLIGPRSWYLESSRSQVEKCTSFCSLCDGCYFCRHWVGHVTILCASSSSWMSCQCHNDWVLVCVLCSACLLLLVLVAVCAVPITVPLTHSQVSYTASGTQFENRERFPRLYTLQPLVYSFNHAYVHLIQSFNWSRVAVMYEVDGLFSAVRPVGGAGWVG